MKLIPIVMAAAGLAALLGGASPARADGRHDQGGWHRPDGGDGWHHRDRGGREGGWREGGWHEHRGWRRDDDEGYRPVYGYAPPAYYAPRAYYAPPAYYVPSPGVTFGFSIR